MKISIRLILTLGCLVLFFSILSVNEIKAQGIISEILKRMEAHNKALVTLSSDVSMQQYNSQLQETDLTFGKMIYVRTPQKSILMRIDWTNPVQESLALINREYLLYRPRLNQVLIGKIDEENTIVGNTVAFVNMSRREILNNYTIRYLGTETLKGKEKVWHLAFEPRKKELSAEMWVDGNGMPIQAKIIETNNDSTTILLTGFKKNEEINTADFKIHYPKNAKILRNSSIACACTKPADAKDALRKMSDAVFSGKVTSVDNVNYTLKTDRTWKGKIGGEVVVQTLSPEAECAVRLAKGESYIVFARQVNVEGKSVLGLMPCSMTSELNSDDGKKILKQLGQRKPLRKITVRKNVYRLRN